MSGIWPTAQQESMLVACLAGETEAAAALHRIAPDWAPQPAPEQIDPGCSQLLPLLYRRWPAKQLPILLSGKKAYASVWRQNRERLRSVAALLEAFRTERIPCVLLKGAAMILRYYEDPGLRTMRDFDVLVRQEDVARAALQLSNLGYVSEHKLAVPSILKRMRTCHAWQFALPDGQSCDLHWRPVVRCFSPEVTNLFWAGVEETRPAAALGIEAVLVLSPTDQLFHVCVHALQWDWVPQIRWVADAMTILREPIEWERIVRLADAAWMRKRLACALEYLRVRFQAPVPQGLTASLDNATPAWERHEYELLLKPCPLGLRDSVAWHRHHFRRVRRFDASWSRTPAWLGFPQYVKEFLNAGDGAESLRALWQETKMRLGRQ